MSCLTNWPAGHNLSLLICGALSGCRACFLDFGFSCIPDFWKSRGCGFRLGVTTGKEVMFIKCAGSAGLSMLSKKKKNPFLLCLSSPMFELIPECRIYFSRRNCTWLGCIFLSLLRQRKIGSNNLLGSSALSNAALPACKCESCSGGGRKTLLPVKRRLLRSVRGVQSN